MLLLSFSVPCWGEVRPLDSSTQPSESNEPLSWTQAELWKLADDSLTIIEESLIAQGEPVESLSISLPELYQKSLELQKSVNELSQRFESLEKSFSNFGRNLAQAIKDVQASKAELMVWKTTLFVSICINVATIFLFNLR
jgi:predicted transcriptional regulator